MCVRERECIAYACMDVREILQYTTHLITHHIQQSYAQSTWYYYTCAMKCISYYTVAKTLERDTDMSERKVYWIEEFGMVGNSFQLMIRFDRNGMEILR